MSAQCESKNAPSLAHGPRLDPIGETTAKQSAGARMGFFERGDHERRLRADRCAVARSVRDYGAVGDIVVVGAGLDRDSVLPAHTGH